MFIANNADALRLFFGELLAEVRSRGHKVLALAPSAEALDLDSARAALAARGVDLQTFYLHPSSRSLYKELYSCVELSRVIRNFRPDVIYASTVKPIVYGTLVGKLFSKAKIYLKVAGLGFAFTSNSFKRLPLRVLVSVLYSIVFKLASRIFVLNPDDLRDLKRLVPFCPADKLILTNGSGVDTEFYKPVDRTTPSRGITFLFIGRLLIDKGIKEFINAARVVKLKYSETRFKVLGPFYPNPSTITSDFLELAIKEGIIEYLGTTTDVRPQIAESDVFVLPSYREGVPRAALEAMSMRKPIITTDAPGCREVVNGKNGILVPVGDSSALALAMLSFIEHPESIEEMGLESRKYCEERFDVRKVNQQIIEIMGL